MRLVTIPAQIVQELGLGIIRGDYPPASVLPNEAELSERFGVSRTVVREALKVLSAKGLIRSRPRVGAVVQPRDAWEGLDSDVLAWSTRTGRLGAFLDQLTEIRHMIEPDAARLAAARATPEELRRVAGHLAAMEESVADQVAFVEHDIAFHAAILQSAHNDLLNALMGTLRRGLRASRQVSTGVLRQDSAESAAARAMAVMLHRQVLEALQARDGQRAHDAMKELLTAVHGAIEFMLDQGERTPRREPLHDQDSQG